MLLDKEQLTSITKGAVEVRSEFGWITPVRFTEAQQKIYADHGKDDFYQKTFAAAGIRIATRTNTSHIRFRYRLSKGSSRKYAWFDVYQNGQMTHHFGSEGMENVEGVANVTLMEGTKDVEIYLPWSRSISLSEVEVDDGATLEPISRSHTMLIFGDSITQGYDAHYPSLSYASRIAALLDADSVNKAIGGDVFFPPLLEAADEMSPDYITVAYGTNDWSHRSYDDVKESCRGFYQKLSALYPNSKIFAITPIWRASHMRKTDFGAPTYAVDDMIREVCADLPNVTVITGWKFTPAHSDFYADQTLHPNDLGFGIYTQNLYAELKKYI